MLILSRRPGDAILIDGGIRIVVLASGQRCVRLGIEAPAEIGIVREEIVSRTPDGGVRVPVLNGLVPKAEPGAEPVAEPGPADDV
jgi:carbon storage regulator